jgi:hypothetical protein
VRNLILFLNQIQLLLDCGMVLELVLAHLEQDFNHVLGSLVNVGFVQDVSELVKDGHGNGWLHVLQILSHLSTETDGNFHTVVGGLMQQQQEDLAGKHLVLNLLVDEVGEESG